MFNYHVFTALDGGMNLGGWCELRWAKASCNRQLYSEHQTVYTLEVKKSHLSKLLSHKDKPYMAKHVNK